MICSPTARSTLILLPKICVCAYSVSAWSAPSWVFGKSTTIRPPSRLRLACVRDTLVWTMIRPPPSGVRRKSTFSIVAAPPVAAAACAAVVGAAAAAAAATVPPTVTNTVLPSARTL